MDVGWIGRTGSKEDWIGRLFRVGNFLSGDDDALCVSLDLVDMSMDFRFLLSGNFGRLDDEATLVVVEGKSNEVGTA